MKSFSVENVNDTSTDRKILNVTYYFFLLTHKFKILKVPGKVDVIVLENVTSTIFPYGNSGHFDERVIRE